MKEYRVYCETYVSAENEEEALEKGYNALFDIDYEVEEVD